MKELIMFDSFAGVGALHKSFKRIGIPVKIGSMSEIDIDAIISYGAIHYGEINMDVPSKEEMIKYLEDRNIGLDFKTGKCKVRKLPIDKLTYLYKVCKATNNYGDISKINPKEMDNFDVMNFSFPCQSVSSAGKKEGMANDDGSITKTGLYIYGINIIKEKKPKYIMIENVKGLIQKKFIKDFYKIINELTEIGYNCYYPKNDKGNPICLNAMNFGIPQKRERIFVICIRKDIDNGSFQLPIGFNDGIKLKDLLEDKVDDKYYLKETKTFFVKNSLNNEMKGNGFRFKPHQRENANLAFTITTKAGSRMDDNFIIDKKINDEPFFEFNKKNIKQFLESDGEMPILHNIYGGFKESEPRIFDDYCPTIRTSAGGGHIPSVCTNDKNKIEKIIDGYKIRKLTPLECWRLMGFDDEDFYKAKAIGISDTQLYKQAGNSIVVNVLEYIFKNLFNI